MKVNVAENGRSKCCPYFMKRVEHIGDAVSSELSVHKIQERVDQEKSKTEFEKQILTGGKARLLLLLLPQSGALSSAVLQGQHVNLESIFYCRLGICKPV